MDTLQFCKADKYFGPNSTWTVQNSLNTSLWLVFLGNIQKGIALGRGFEALNNMSSYY